MGMAQKIHTYTDLLQKIHDDLRIQHPEWIQPDGESPMCDSYEARLMELLAASIGSGPSETTGVPDSAFEIRTNPNLTLTNWERFRSRIGEVITL